MKRELECIPIILDDDGEKIEIFPEKWYSKLIYCFYYYAEFT